MVAGDDIDHLGYRRCDLYVAESRLEKLGSLNSLRIVTILSKRPDRATETEFDPEPVGEA